MSVVYKKEVLDNGLVSAEVYDDKFKTFRIIVRMIVPLDKERVPLSMLALDILTMSNRKYPEREDFVLALTELYNGGINSGGMILGDCYVHSVSMSCLCDEYTIGKEKISDKAADMLLDTLFDPLLEDGHFSQKYFELCRGEMLDDIAAMINNKRQYAALLSKKHIYEGEPNSISPFDYKELIENTTVEAVTEAYRKLLSSAYYIVSVTGGSSGSEAGSKIRERIKALERRPVFNGKFRSPSPLKKEVRFAEAETEAKQAQLIMAYKPENYNEYSSKLFATMLGSYPMSKLFMNVREKLSLCYYCDAVISDVKATVIISSGLDIGNLDKARVEINKQIEALANGDFTDEELNAAKLHLADAYLSNYDSKMDIETWYFYQFIRGSSDSPEDKGGKIMALTRQDVMDAARSYKLDTVFVMKPGNGGV